MADVLNDTARELFAPIASTYERWARILSLGQDGRWRRVMVNGVDLAAGSKVLDVAAGTGSITRLLQRYGHKVTAVDLSADMLSQHPGPTRIRARAEMLPFTDAGFDAVTFGYLLRYTDDPVATLQELARVVKPGGKVGMVEFGLPDGFWRPIWNFYTAVLLRSFGRVISPGWHDVGRFLKGSIEEFYRRYPDPIMLWEKAGLVDIHFRRLSLGGGLVMWATRP